MDLPTHQELKSVIVDIITRARDDDRLSELTVRIVRQELEKHFSLDEDALGSKEYKTVIKRIVRDTVDTLDKALEESAAEVKPKTSKKKNTARKETTIAKPVSSNVGESKTGARKRKPKAVVPPSDEESPAEEAGASESEAPSSKKASACLKPSKVKSDKPTKPSKPSKKPESDKKYKSKATIESSEDEGEPKVKATPSRSPKKEQPSPKSPSSKHKKPAQKTTKADSDVDMETYEDSGPSPISSKPQLPTASPKSSNPKKEEAAKDPMDSELSSVIDEPPKKRQKKQDKGSEKPKKDERTKRGKKEPMSKDEETVNKLKGIVVACGIRKVWKKEFEGIDKPSQQIKRLHQILGELGMTPRYSLEKAKAIRERRELAQELKDVQEFEKATQRRANRVRSSPETEASEEESDGDDAQVPVRKKGNARASIMAFLQDQSDEE